MKLLVLNGPNLNLLGLNLSTLNIALPIGISFYTFQTMSYPIDLYRKQTDPQKSLVSFGAYVTMFPQLIAGPIVRYADVALQMNDRKESCLTELLVNIFARILEDDSNF